MPKRNISQDIKKLQTLLEAHQNDKRKEWWQNYVKNGAPFIGAKMSEIRSELHQWHKDSIKDKYSKKQQIELALHLIREKHSEHKLAGILFFEEILIPNNVIEDQLLTNSLYFSEIAQLMIGISVTGLASKY